MENFKGTKGKWGYELKYNNGHINLLADNAEIKIAEIIVNPFSETGETEAEYNAKLIASAPELLEMVKLLVDRMEENDLGGFSAVSRAYELIKKATE